MEDLLVLASHPFSFTSNLTFLVFFFSTEIFSIFFSLVQKKKKKKKRKDKERSYQNLTNMVASVI